MHAVQSLSVSRPQRVKTAERLGKCQHRLDVALRINKFLSFER